ncbi:MAG: hypothetical protein R3F65_23625 [bacterium]
MSSYKTVDVAAAAAWPAVEDPDALVFQNTDAGVLGVLGLRLRAPAANVGEVRVRFNRNTAAHVRIAPGEVRTLNFPVTDYCRSLSVLGNVGDSVVVESSTDGYADAVDVQVGPVGAQGPGPCGPAGPAGPAGAQGEPGELSSVYAQVQASAAGQTITNGNSAVVTFTDANPTPTNQTLVDGATGVTTIPVGEGGRYLFNFVLISSAALTLAIQLSSDEGDNWTTVGQAPAGSLTLVEVLDLPAGMQVRLEATNNSGGLATLTGINGNNRGTRLNVARIQ